MDLDRLHHAQKIAIAAAGAIIGLAILEVSAYVGFHESAEERTAFGYSRDASFSVEGSLVAITPTASRLFWMQHYPQVEPQGWKRIMVIGDSTARGKSFEQSLSETLRRKLSERCALRTEVWNLASPGYGSRRKHLVVDKALEFHPDLIIYHAGFLTEYIDAREWERHVEFQSWHPRNWIDHLPFLGRVRLSKLDKLYSGWLAEDVRAASREDPLAIRIAAIASRTDWRYWMPRMLSNLDVTVEEVRKAGVPLLILVHAYLDRDSGSVIDADLAKVVALRYASKTGVMVISGRELFSSRPEVLSLYSDSTHWTPAGTDWVAEALERYVGDLFNGEGGCAGVR